MIIMRGYSEQNHDFYDLNGFIGNVVTTPF